MKRLVNASIAGLLALLLADVSADSGWPFWASALVLIAAFANLRFIVAQVFPEGGQR